MRIRSIKPEFWRSEDISGCTIEDRLLFIGLWSYVDDNGVGKDSLAMITADLFADDLEQDSRETFARVSRGLANLSAAGLIVRYKVENRPYLYILTWDKHQRIDRPGKPRYPLPTREDAEFATPSRDSRETLAPGAVEQGSSGTGEQVKTSSTARAIDGEFEREFWPAYPRKVAKGAALKAYRAARAKIPHDQIMSSLAVFVRAQLGQDANFIPHAATWLNQGRWDDNPEDIAPPRTNGHQRETNDIFERMLNRAPEVQKGITA